MSAVNALPTVGVVIPTCNRPVLMRRALGAVLAQNYTGPIHVMIVFDRCAVEADLSRTGPRSVTAVRNQRSPGLAGARNTGIAGLDTDLIAFCDDDDFWLPGKLAAQVARLSAVPDAGFCTTAIRVDCGQRSVVRRANSSRVTVADLSRSRMSMLHSSSFLFWRDAMVSPSGFGLVEEVLQGSMAEDWDLLLRASRVHPIEHVDEPLTAVQWGNSSYFNGAWVDRNSAHAWLLAHHPEMSRDPQALGLMLSKMAFGSAALGSRSEAVRLAGRAFAANWREPRTPLALLVAAGVSPRWMTNQLNVRGHGI